MKNKSYMHLQNGSDIRGVAIANEKDPIVTLDKDAAMAIAFGFQQWLSKKLGISSLTIAIGHDSRLTAHTLKESLIQAFNEIGNITVLDAGLSSTPAMFMSTKFDEYKCNGAIMITASHLPYNRNGFKFFHQEGGLDKGDITEILVAAEKYSSKHTICNSRRDIPLMKTYSTFLKNKIISETSDCKEPLFPLKGLHIVIDAGNGAGGFFAKEILEPLGAKTSGSQFLEPDGHFPNHIPNPEDKEAMQSICKCVINNKADLGIIFDTDVDRISAVDRHGNEINRNAIVALAASLISQEHPGTTVVTDSITSDELSHYLINDLNISHLRYKRGYKNVINKAIELNHKGIDSQLAIETSGHAAFKENFFLDDGAYLATKIVIKAAQLMKTNSSIEALIETLEHPQSSVEIRLPIKASDFGHYGDTVLSLLESESSRVDIPQYSVTTPNYEGVRIDYHSEPSHGWALLRKSLHDPIMPLNIEANSAEAVDEIKKYIYHTLKGFQELDLSKLIPPDFDN